MSDATRQAEILRPLVTGFMTAYYSSLQENGRHVHALGKDDFDRVMAGFGCGECLATFDTYMETCPVCGLSREIGARWQDDPDNWNAYHDEHLNGSGKTQTRDVHQFLDDLQKDKDVDHVELSRLRENSMWRRVRRN